MLFFFFFRGVVKEQAGMLELKESRCCHLLRRTAAWVAPTRDTASCDPPKVSRALRPPPSKKKKKLNCCSITKGTRLAPMGKRGLHEGSQWQGCCW